MSNEFADLASFGMHLIEREAATLAALHTGLGKVAQKIEDSAKAEIGFYQPERGPFPAWAELAESTEEAKARQGYPLDAPLLRTGEMRDSIKHETQALEAVVGSDDQKMYWHEFGTAKMPPRPVLGPAAFMNKDAIEKILGAAAVSGLIGGGPIHQALGYDFKTE